MPDKNDKKLNDFFKAVKSVESEREHDLSGQRRIFILRIFLNKWFMFIVLILLIVICLIIQQ